MLTSDLRGDQLAPHSIEAEEAVLGSILINPEALTEVVDLLKPDDFFIVRHQWIYQAILDINRRQEPIDFVTVVSELEQSAKTAEIGGQAYVLGLINKTPSALNVEGYSLIVARMALRRRLIEAATQVVRVAHSDETDIEEVVSRSQAAIMDAIGNDTSAKLYPNSVVISENYDRTMEAQRGGGAGGYTTGLTPLDRLSRGFKKGDLIIVAGRPGMGKTASMLVGAVANAESTPLKQGVAVGIASYEMSRHALERRNTSQRSGILYSELEEGRIPDHKHNDHVEAMEWGARLPIIYMDDASASTPQALRMKARQMAYQYGIKLLFVDYIQLMNAVGHQGKNRNSELSEISRSLKLLARELDIPVIVGSQLSRGVEARQDKRPLLSDLRESGALEQDADMVIFLYRDSYYDKGSLKGDLTEFNVAKNRNGATGTVEVLWHPTRMWFGEAPRNQPSGKDLER